MTEDEKVAYLAENLYYLSDAGKDYIKSLSQILLSLQMPAAEFEALKRDFEKRNADVLKS